MLLPFRLLRAGVVFAFALAMLLTASRSAKAGDAVASILLLVHGDDLPRERLRDLVAHELGKPVALAGAGQTGSLGVVTVTYRRSSKELAVTWDAPKQRTVSRVVTAPAKMDDVVRDAAMLAGNLARDEAADLVAPPANANASETTEAPPPLPPPVDPSATTPAEVAPPRGEKPRSKEDREEVTLGFFYPLSTNLGRPWARTSVDFNLLFGRVGQVDAFQLGGLNVVAQPDGKGTGDVHGVQIAWLGNIATGRVGGLQIAAGVNVGGKHVEGWQAATLVNHAGGDLIGLQTSPLVNHTGGTMTGAQAGLVNVAQAVRGAQLGLVNVGGKVAGTMLGLVNVADDVDGVPIGLASVTRSGGVHPQAWSSTGTLASVGVKLATKHTYTMPSAHYHRAYDRDFVGGGFTIGGHIPLGEGRGGPYVDTDLSVAWLIAPEQRPFVTTFGEARSYNEHLLQPRVRAMFGYRFVEHFGLFAGPGLLTQVRFLREGDEALVRVGPELLAGIEL